MKHQSTFVENASATAVGLVAQRSNIADQVEGIKFQQIQKHVQLKRH
jgi:hypothetical protein